MKFLVISPAGGGRLSLIPDIVEGIKENGVKAINFLPGKAISRYIINKKLKDKYSLKECIDISWEYAIFHLKKLVESYKPDIILDLAPIPKELILEFKKKKIKMIFWLIEDGYLPQYHYWKEVGPYYDYFLTFQPGNFLKELERHGIKKGRYLPLGCSFKRINDLNLKETDLERYKGEISFMGAPYPNRIKIFKRLAKDGYDFKIWGRGWEKIFDEDLERILGNGKKIERKEVLKIYKSTKINLNIHSSMDADKIGGDFINPRTFEIAGCAGFQLVDKREALPLHFDIGKEIVEFEDIEDLKEKIKFFLKYGEKREEIAKNSQRRVILEHTYKHRINRLLKIISRD